MTDKVKILGFAGSLRKKSYNRGLLDAAAELLPEDADLISFDLKGIPLFNQDLESEPPEKVREFRKSVKSADAILIVTPEYNYSISGVLKNAIDWASRPYVKNTFRGKPVAFMGASTGMLGTARAQYHLRQCCVFLEMLPINKPEVFVAYAGRKFNENGILKDQETKEHVKQLLQELVAWTKKLKC
jgi:chromate reductase